MSGMSMPSLIARSVAARPSVWVSSTVRCRSLAARTSSEAISAKYGCVSSGRATAMMPLLPWRRCRAAMLGR